MRLLKGAHGRRRVELTLRASVINKGLSLSQLKTGCGVYGAIVSVEDHGYVVSLGLDGITSFLPVSECENKAMKAGQPIETVIKVSFYSYPPFPTLKLRQLRPACPWHLP